MEILIILIIFGIIFWTAIQIIIGRFHKSVYKFNQYGMDFKVIKTYLFYEVINCNNIVWYTRVGIIDLPAFKPWGVKDLKEGAHKLVTEEYPFEREEWEEVERQMAEEMARLEHLDDEMIEDIVNNIKNTNL